MDSPQPSVHQRHQPGLQGQSLQRRRRRRQPSPLLTELREVEEDAESRREANDIWCQHEQWSVLNHL